MSYITIAECDRCGSQGQHYDIKHVEGEGIDLCTRCIESIELSIKSRTASGKYDSHQVRDVIFMLIRSKFKTITKRDY